MPVMNRRTVGDLLLCASVVAGSSILFIGAADLPPPRFEPMGSAAVPRILGAILIALSLVVAVQALRNKSTDRAQAAPDEPPATIPYRGLAVLAALVAYVFALDVGRVPFLLATPLFVTAAGLSMSHLSARNLLAFAALGLTVALLLDTVLSRFLYITIG